MQFATASGLLVGILSTVLAVASADAKNCGGDVACECGDTLRGVAVLTGDLRSCADDGLRLKNDALLDCAGHELSGSRNGEGVLLDGAVGATVLNCRIAGFKTGVRIRGGRDNLVSGNEITGNRRYGVELAKATTGNQLQSNRIVGSGDEGVHIGSNAHGTVVVGNEIEDSKRENLYVLSADGGVFTANFLSGSGDAAIYVKHSSGNVFAANEVRGHIVHVRGHSIANRFEDTHMQGGRFVFEAYKDKHPAGVKGWTRPADNEVVGGAVLDTKTCFQFKGASDNQASGVAENGCRAKKQSKKGGQKAKRNAVSLVESPT
ncbi:MAG: right-handed parallel beta-helix repeat-containing protein [Candidatus Binatia bacterium]|nr:right-handed parallel beta-helix repeat-containing protein [Candidatus Binatia bacterium]